MIGWLGMGMVVRFLVTLGLRGISGWVMIWV